MPAHNLPLSTFLMEKWPDLPHPTAEFLLTFQELPVKKDLNLDGVE
jgi:hypothetical protein